METGPRDVQAPPPRPPSPLGPALLALAVVVGLGVARQLAQRSPVTASVEAWIDPGGARLVRAPEWADPRWLEHLGALLARAGPFEARSAEASGALAAEIAGLSFVERVERCETGPGGFALALLLREPVACIGVRGEYALVDADGVVLEGTWPVPPRLGRAFLPVLGAPDDPLLARARPGDWLAEPEHQDALDVALSLAQELGPDERAALGRMRIDARTARRASVGEPGVRLELEGGRTALFGRAPSSSEPGELAAACKWDALRRALQLFEQDPVGLDWERVDLRWDRPDIALRHPVVAAVEPERPHRPRGTPARSADDSRPRVR